MQTQESIPFIIQYWNLVVYGVVYVLALTFGSVLRKRNVRFFTAFLIAISFWSVSWLIDIYGMYQFHKNISNAAATENFAILSALLTNVCVILNLFGWGAIIISLFFVSRPESASA